MKCLIFSDSHGNREGIISALDRHKTAELVFFLGDGVREAEEIALCDTKRTWFFVLGNCDFKTDALGSKIKKTDEIILFGKKIVFTHGDLYGVKLHDEGIRSLALSREADIVLFGHTHTPSEDFVSIEGRGVYFFNPGSLSGGSRCESYGILTIDEKNVLFSHGRV